MITLLNKHKIRFNFLQRIADKISCGLIKNKINKK